VETGAPPCTTLTRSSREATVLIWSSASVAPNAHRWVNCVILPSRQAEVMEIAHRLGAESAKARYQAISQAVWGTPDRWYFVALAHEREAGAPPH
jgi:lysozyme family protein